MAQMERLEIGLTEEQAAALRELASRRHVSVEELLQEEVAHLVGSADAAGDEERWQRALAALGQFRSGTTDLSVRHDDYLAADVER